MHLARLHALVHLKDSPIPIEGTSDLITDRGRYEVRYDNLSKNIILNNSVLQKYILAFDKCMPTDKVEFSGEFVHVDKDDEQEQRIVIDKSELQIIHIMRTGHEKKCVEVYFTTSSGKILGGAIDRKYKIYFQLKVVENGNLGEASNYSRLVSEKNIIECEIGACINHECELDHHLRNSGTCSIDEMLIRATAYVERQQGYSNNNQCGECCRAKYNLQTLCNISKKLTLGSDLIVEEPATSDNSHSPPKTVIFEEIGKDEIESSYYN